MAAGPDESFYLSFDDLNWNTPSVALPTCGIGVDKSTDGGTTWTGTTLSGTACDGPKIVADLSDGRIYEASSGSLGSRSTLNPSDPLVFPDSPNDRYVSSTTDGATWTTPHGMGGLDTSVSPAAYRSGGGGQMSAANGTIAVAFRSTSTFACSFFVGTSSPCLVFQSSTDAGATWTRHAVTNAATTILSAVMTAADPSTPGHYTVGGLNSSNQFVTYQTTDSGLRHALFLTRLHNRFLRTGLAELTDPDPPLPSPLRTADRAYTNATDDNRNDRHFRSPGPIGFRGI